MGRHGRTVLIGAVVFAIAMGALASGGWWWAWLAAAGLVLCNRCRLLRMGWVILADVTRCIVATKYQTWRHNREQTQRQQRRTRRRQAG
jgi:hypothetical protein